MNKNDLVEHIAYNAEIGYESARELVEIVLDGILEGLENDGCVKIRGFGSLEVKQYAARIGRNPRNPEQTFEIGPSKNIRFIASKELKAKINK